MHSRFGACLLLVPASGAVLASDGCTGSPPTQAPPTDTDGDGLSDQDELHVYGTSPVLADTDGDGISDYDEIVKYGFDPSNNPYLFNPRVADVPQLSIAFVGAPTVTIHVQDATGATQTFETSNSTQSSITGTIGTTTTVGRADTLATSQSLSNSSTVAKTVRDPTSGGRGGAGGAGGSASRGGGGTVLVTASTDVTSSVSPSTTNDTTLEMSKEDEQQNAQTLEQSQSYQQSHLVTSADGLLTVAAVIANPGHVAFRLTNLLLTATLVDASGATTPIGNLDIDSPPLTSTVFSLAPGEQTGPVNFSKDLLPLEVAQGILNNAANLHVVLATSELTNAQGVPFAFDQQSVSAKTAAIQIDYGGARAGERYLVATNENPAKPGVTAGKALREILHIPFEANGERGLVTVRNIGVGGNWVLQYRHDDGVDVTTSIYAPSRPYDFENVELFAGDALGIDFTH